MMTETTPGKTNPRTNPALKAPPAEPVVTKTGNDLSANLETLIGPTPKAAPVEPNHPPKTGSDLDASELVEEKFGNG